MLRSNHWFVSYDYICIRFGHKTSLGSERRQCIILKTIEDVILVKILNKKTVARKYLQPLACFKFYDFLRLVIWGKLIFVLSKPLYM